MLSDKELQEIFEANPEAFKNLATQDEDARLYEILFETLPLLHQEIIVPEIADKVVETLAWQASKSEKRKNILFVLSIGLAVCFGILLVVTFVPQIQLSFKGLSSYLAFIVSALAVFLGVEFLDKKLVWK